MDLRVSKNLYILFRVIMDIKRHRLTSQQSFYL